MQITFCKVVGDVISSIFENTTRWSFEIENVEINSGFQTLQNMLNSTQFANFWALCDLHALRTHVEILLWKCISCDFSVLHFDYKVAEL